MPNEDRCVRDQLLELLRGGSAHASLDTALKDFPSSLYAQKPDGAPHNAWQTLEHIRLTLHDLLEFCRNPKYQAPQWPEDYWPKQDAPASSEAWHASVRALQENIREFEMMLRDSKVDLYAKILWGNGQTILREVLLAADHTSYHIGQMVMLRKQLGAWKS